MMSTIPPVSEFASLKGVRAGVGKRVVFIHGVGLCHQAWAPQIEHFSQSHEVIALDLPGHGHSPLGGQLNSDSLGFRDFTNRIAEAISDKDFVLVGHSLGALISLAIAMGHSANFKGVVLANPVYQRSAEAKAAVLARAEALNKNEDNNEATLDRWYGNEFPELRVKSDTWLNQSRLGYSVAYRLFAQYVDPVPSALSAMKHPALIITGENDPNSTPEMTYALAEALPNATACVINEARHMMPLTHVAEFNQTLTHFLGEIGHA